MNQRDTFVRVYFQDTDAGGVVFHGSYLHFFERGRTEWLRDLGITQSKLKDSHEMLIVVRKIKLRYIKPARLDDLLYVRTSLSKLGRAQMTLVQEVFRSKTLLVISNINLGFVSARDISPMIMPDVIRENFAKLDGFR